MENNYIPYQLCPKCNGNGVCVPNMNMTISTMVCDVCNGKKIIPMFKKEE